MDITEAERTFFAQCIRIAADQIDSGADLEKQLIAIYTLTELHLRRFYLRDGADDSIFNLHVETPDT